jgi:ribonuclease P protein component
LHCVALGQVALTEPSIPAISSAVFRQTEQSHPSRPLFAQTGVWMGAMVPKRWAKRAVTRNAIKRQIYIAGTRAEPHLQPAAHVVRLRAGFDKKLFPSATSDALKQVVRCELDQLFAKAALLLKNKAPLVAEKNRAHAGQRVDLHEEEALDSNRVKLGNIRDEEPKATRPAVESNANRAMTI